MAVPLSAATTGTSGNFTYSDDGTSITITGYPQNAVGAVEIPSTINGKPVTKIGGFAFSDCTGLTSISIPSSVTTIGAGAFSDCTGLTSVSIPSGITSIQPIVFSRCTALTSVSIPDGVTYIGNQSFSGCTALTSVVIPSSVTRIGSEAFSDCTALTSVIIPSSVTTIGTFAFDGCTGLASISVDAANPNYSSSDGVLFDKLQTSLIQCPEGKGGAYTIPSSVTDIRDFAFYGCTELTSISIPSSVTTIGAGAFYDCIGLASVSIPPGVTTIGDQAFAGCLGLADVSIPSSVTSIGDNAFYDCTGLVSFSVDAANPNYSSLDGMLFDKLQTSLIKCPASKSGAYTIPSSVTRIEGYAFYYCTKLTSVSIPSGVTSIGNHAFTHCTGLVAFSVDAANQNYSSLDGVLFNKLQTSLIKYPAGKSGAYAIPSSVTSIGDYAFYYCTKLTGVSISPGVTSIGSYAFFSCHELTTATFTGNAPSLGFSVFANAASGFTVYYTNGSSGFTSPTWQGYPSQIILAQTITFGPLSDKTYGDAPFTLSATASSGLTPTFSIVSGLATISGDTVTLTGAGTVTVRASQAGSAGYLAADPVDQSFTVAKSGQTITFAQPADRLSSDAPFTLNATADSGQPVTFSIVSGPAMIGGDGQTLTLTGTAGTVTVRASQAGTESYFAAASVDRSFTVSKPTRTQTITFKPPAKALMTTASLTLTATSSSGLPVSFTVVSGPATLGDDGKTLTLTGAGSVVVKATQAGDEVYLPASTVQKTIQVSRVSQKIAFKPPAKALMTAASLTLTATSSSGLPVSFTVVSGPAALGDDGRTLTLTGAGSVVVKATQAGNEVYLPATALQRTIKVSRVDQRITFTPPATVAMSDSPLILTATASSGLPVTFTVSGPATLIGTTLTLTGVGKVTVKASQPGNTVYNAAATITKTIKVTAALATSLVSKSIAPTFGDVDGAHVALLVGADGSSSGGLPVGTFDLQVDTAKKTYTAILTRLDGSDPLFISGTVEAGGTDANPLITAQWPEPGETSPCAVEFSLSGDGLVVTVSLDDEIIAETEAGVMTK